MRTHSTARSWLTGLMLALGVALVGLPAAAEEASLDPAVATGGQIVWRRTPVTGQAYATANQVGVDAAGNVYVYGRKFLDWEAPQSRLFLYKYNKLGALVWKVEPASSTDHYPGAMAVAATGEIVTYHQTAASGSTSHYLRRYAKDGSLLWQRSLTGGVVDLVIGKDNTILVILAIPDLYGIDAVSLLKYSAGGALLSNRALPWIGCSLDAAAIDATGNIFLGGSSRLNACVAKVNANLTLAWRRYFYRGDPDEENRAVALAADGRGGVIVAGQSVIMDISGDITTEGFLLKYTAGGGLGWKRRIGDVGHTGIVLTPSGDFYTSGFSPWRSPQPTRTQALVAKVRGSDGARLWLREYGADSVEDVALDIARDPFGNLLISGEFSGIGNGNAGAFVTKLRP